MGFALVKEDAPTKQQEEEFSELFQAQFGRGKLPTFAFAQFVAAYRLYMGEPVDYEEALTWAKSLPPTLWRTIYPHQKQEYVWRF